jgi:CheY-like chemotaxis protein
METCLVELPHAQPTATSSASDSATFSDPATDFYFPESFSRLRSHDGDPRVLVVGADRRLIDLTARQLRSTFDVTIDVAANGVEALELAAVERYVLVIAEAEMPMMSGLELFLWLREIQPGTAERFVLIAEEPRDAMLVSEPPIILPKSSSALLLEQMIRLQFDRFLGDANHRRLFTAEFSPPR